MITYTSAVLNGLISCQKMAATTPHFHPLELAELKKLTEAGYDDDKFCGLFSACGLFLVFEVQLHISFFDSLQHRAADHHCLESAQLLVSIGNQMVKLWKEISVAEQALGRLLFDKPDNDKTGMDLALANLSDAVALLGAVEWAVAIKTAPACGRTH